MLIDSDLEYDPKDCLKMFRIIKSNSNMEVLFGSRYLGGKIKHRKYKMILLSLNSLFIIDAISFHGELGSN